MKKLLSIATLMALAALPLAAQSPEMPAEDPLAQEQEQDYGVETQPVAESEAFPAEDPIAQEESYGTETQAVAEIEAGDEELPRTASPLALIAMLGTAGAAAGYGVRRLRSR
jgi:hypothetical protein